MAIRANAGTVTLTLTNANRVLANPVFQFPGGGGVARSCFSIWVKPLSRIPATVFTHRGTDGSFVSLFHDGNNWFMGFRNGTDPINTIGLAGVTLDTWQVWSINRFGDIFSIYIGVQPISDPSPSTHPITLILVSSFTLVMNYAFESIEVVINSNMHTCNFKFWSEVLSMAQIEQQCQRWEPQYAGMVGTAPIWSSTLRTPGDISSICGVNTSATWDAGHGYTNIDFPNNLVFESPDPAYMATNQPCPTWIYLLTGVGNVTKLSFNPGNTPAVLTIYDAADKFEFQNRGSLPASGSCVALYCGFPYNSGAGIGPLYTSSLFIGETGIVTLPDPTLPINQFQTNTTVPVPAALNLATIYGYSYGCRFTWAASTPVPAATANLEFAYLYVTYTGFPTGVPLPPAGDLTGLFVIKRGQLVDRYNRAVELKIPDPLVRLAYIGE